MASEIQALNVLSVYISEHDGYLPQNPNQLVSYSCSRYDLRTLDYREAKNIMAIYQRNVDRLRNNGNYGMQIVPFSKYKHSKRKTLVSLPKIALTEYDDVRDMSDTDDDTEIDIESTTDYNSNCTTCNISDISDTITTFVSENDGLLPTADELVILCNQQLSYHDADNIIKIYRYNFLQHKSVANPHKCCYCKIDSKLTKSDFIVLIVWVIMMMSTIFGVTFGMIHIGFGIDTFNESASVSKETCQVINYTKNECQYEHEHQLYNDYKYDYILVAASKCNNNTLYRRKRDPNNEECGVRTYDMNVNVSCYVSACNKNEYSFIGFHDLSFDAKEDIELGCIALLVTVVPFISFISWVTFCYRCGSNTS